MFVGDDALKAQEVLHASQLAGRVADEPLAAHKQDLLHGEVLQPVVQVLGVDADLDGAPRRVDEARSPVLEGEALEGRNVGLLGQSLRVVRDGPGDWVAHYHDQFGLMGHAGDAAGCLPCDKVAGGLLQCDLTVQCSWHETP